MSVPRYLQAGFDPMSIKMDSIRDILIHYKVKPPTGAVKKQDLVDLFEQHIRPRSAELRKRYEQAVPVQNPTTKAPSPSSSSSKAQTQGQPRPQPPSQPQLQQSAPSTAPITTSAAAAATIQPTRQEAAVALSSSTSSHSSSSSSRRHAPTKPIHTDEKTETRPRPRRKIVEEGTDMESSSTSSSIRGRKSLKSAFQKEEEGSEPTLDRRSPRKKKSEDSKRLRDHSGENFSDENPFQSGSESERRRRPKPRESSTSAGSSRNSSTVRKSRRKSRDDATRPDRDHVFKVPAQPAFSKYMATPKYSSGKAFDRTEFDSGPFHNSPLFAKTKRMSSPTLPPPPLQILQLESASKAYGTRSRRDREREGSNLGPLKFLFFMAFLSYGLWYRQTRMDIGFCTPSTSTPPPTSIEPLTTQQRIVKWLYPTCIACPDHATCITPDSEPVCPPEYILRPHPLSFGNLLPLPPNCVLNKAQEYQSLQVADAAEKILHRRAGQEECRSSSRPEPTAELLARQRFSIPELKSEIESLKDVRVSQEEFDQYWNLALNELYRRSGTIIIEQGIGERYLRSLRPNRPFFCRVRQGVIGWIEQFKEILIALMTLTVGGLLIRNHITKRREEVRIVQELVEQVLSKLSEQVHYYYIDPVIYPELFVPQIHLRDALLTDIHSHVRRQEIWEKVSLIVDRNANVRVSAQEVRGEIHRVWEWIGASGVLSQKKGLGASGRSNGDGNGNCATDDRGFHENEHSLHASTGGSLYPSLS